ncbi:MAG TPA: hypothetical protein VIJ62_04380, partial [Rhizomicrobium sp.]
MSEQMSTQPSEFRRQLLTTVSALALLASACGANAADNDADRPPLWIELGGQFERLSGGSEQFTPSFFSLASQADIDAMLDAQRPSPYSLGEEGKISLAPEDTNWVFSAAIRYGRSKTTRHSHHETPAAAQGPIYVGTFYVTKNFVPRNFAYGDAQTSLSESHLVADFQAGKDVGLGMFGMHGTSTVSAGVRFAQFSSGSEVTLHARPIYNFNFVTSPGKYRIPHFARANYTAIFQARRSTHAIGPSISWDASVPLAGTTADATINLDWGANAAVLFGRQRANVHHQTHGYYYKVLPTLAKYTHVSTNHPPDQNRARFVTIPNVGGFAGVSLKFLNAKVALGYRADFFFGALDGGIDSHKSETLGFYGPFATISVGIGG